MPDIHVRGVELRYEVLGDSGPGIALVPGGRNGVATIKSLAQRFAQAGYRVLIHDRRNCGASDVVFDASASEDHIAADDLHTLLQQLGMLPAIIGGSSSGARVALGFALRHPQALRALLLWRVTGGAFAVRRLVEKYYDEFARAAEQGGMAAVCATEHFAEVIRNKPSNCERLLSTDPEIFVGVMRRWRELFAEGAEMPLVGVSARDLRSITVPVCLIPGDDLTHLRQAAIDAAGLLPDCELHPLTQGDQEMDVSPPEEWQAREAAIFANLYGLSEPQAHILYLRGAGRADRQLSFCSSRRIVRCSAALSGAMVSAVIFDAASIAAMVSRRPGSVSITAWRRRSPGSLTISTNPRDRKRSTTPFTVAGSRQMRRPR